MRVFNQSYVALTTDLVKQNKGKITEDVIAVAKSGKRAALLAIEKTSQVFGASNYLKCLGSMFLFAVASILT